MRVNLNALKKVRVCVIDTSEMISVLGVSSPERRCQYIERLLDVMDYPLEVLPWEYEKIISPASPRVDDIDLSIFFDQLTTSLRKLGYEGEPLIVSPSKGMWVLLHFFKE